MKIGGHVANLDILRSVAVLAVFAAHSFQVMAGAKFGEHYAFGIDTYSLGRVGVLVFFVHTSLVLMQSLERMEARISGWPLVGAFYIRRAFRIYPLSICLVVLSIGLRIPPNALGISYQWRGMRWALANLFLVQNIADVNNISSPLWSLPYEVQMYLLLPLLYVVLRARRRMLLFAGIYVIGAFLSLLHPLFRYFPCFLGGILAYLLLGRVRPRFAGWLWYPAVTGVVIFYVCSPYSDGSWLKDVLICLLVGTLIPQFQNNRGPLTDGAARVAKYSYGIYLCHTPLLWLIYQRLSIPDWQRAIWLFLAVGTVSVACYHAIEEPLINAGTRVAGRVARRRAPLMPAETKA